MFHDETTEDDHDFAAMEIFIYRNESSHSAKKKFWPKNFALYRSPRIVRNFFYPKNFTL